MRVLACIDTLVEPGPDDDAQREDGEAAHLRVGLQGGQAAPCALGPVEAIEAQVPALCRAEVDLEGWFDVIIFQCELR